MKSTDFNLSSKIKNNPDDYVFVYLVERLRKQTAKEVEEMERRRRWSKNFNKMRKLLNRAK